MNISILESKLNRHKISFSKENGEIIIGKAKRDIVDYFGLGIVPVLIGIGIIVFFIINIKNLRIGIFQMSGAALFLIGIGVSNLRKYKRKKLANTFPKIFKENKIIVRTPLEDYKLDASTIMEIRVTNKLLDNETYEGNLFIIDNNNGLHHILRFHDESEKYVQDDLKWFEDFILTQTGLKK